LKPVSRPSERDDRTVLDIAPEKRETSVVVVLRQGRGQPPRDDRLLLAKRLLHHRRIVPNDQPEVDGHADRRAQRVPDAHVDQVVHRGQGVHRVQVVHSPAVIHVRLPAKDAPDDVRDQPL